MATNALFLYNGSESVQLDPTPLVALSVNQVRNKLGKICDEYSINLNGYIMSSGLADFAGSPTTQSGNGIDTGHIFEGQNRLRGFLSHPDLCLEFNALDGTAKFHLYPYLESLNFEEGTYYQYCKWNATLKAYDLFAGPKSGSNNRIISARSRNSVLIDFNEDVSIEPVVGEYGYVFHGLNQHNPITNRYYKYSRTLTATGKDLIPSLQYNHVFGQSGSIAGSGSLFSSDLAKSYLYHYANNPDTIRLQIASGLYKYVDEVNGAVDAWELYNFERSEQANISDGTYSITDNFIIAPTGTSAIETFSHNINTGQDSPYHKITIDGTVKGLSTWNLDQYASGITNVAQRTQLSSLLGGESDKAKEAYGKISNNGQFGSQSTIYKRCNALTGLQLNSQPLSVSLGTNPLTGELTYNLEFDSRPTNFFSRVISERIEVNDTYPGDLFATIQVLGRPTGPVLQYTYGRTEFKRDLSIEVMLDQTWIGYQHGSNLAVDVLRTNLLYSKPSLVSSFRDELNKLITIYSPANEPGIRRFFQNAPQESWNAKEGRYTLNLSWTYELSE